MYPFLDHSDEGIRTKVRLTWSSVIRGKPTWPVAKCPGMDCSMMWVPKYWMLVRLKKFRNPRLNPLCESIFRFLRNIFWYVFFSNNTSLLYVPDDLASSIWGSELGTGLIAARAT